jgi:predicted nuclease of restriction endonuclease-like RecB superfamily
MCFEGFEIALKNVHLTGHPDAIYTLPDFYVVDLDVYVEVKGWWRDDAREKFNAFVSEYPALKCALVMKEQLEAIERRELELEACIFTSSRSTTCL